VFGKVEAVRTVAAEYGAVPQGFSSRWPAPGGGSGLHGGGRRRYRI